MLPKIHLDYETYSEIDLRAVGGMRYAEDPTTEILIAAWAIEDGEPEVVDMTLPDAFDRMDKFFSLIDRGAIVCAHNAHFERAVTEKASGFPVIPKPHQWNCTAARARMLAIPGSLDGAAHALGLKIRKDPRGDELIKIFSKPDKKKGRCYPTDRPDDFKSFMEYCANDVRVETQLDKVLPELPPVEQEAFALDYKINNAGMPVNMDRVRAADRFVEEHSNELMCRAVAISGCRPSQRERTLEFLESRGILLPNLQAGTVENLAAREDLDPEIKELMDLRIEVSRAGTKKLKAIQDCVSPDGRIRGGFLFSAASTRRWSSTGVQMHNLQKPEDGSEVNPTVLHDLLEDDPFDLRLIFNRPLTAIAQSVRGFFESPDAHFLVADYASVEPRGLAWSANEEWLLQAYLRGEDAYKIAAARVYGIRPDQVTPAQRFMGKQLILGCGYQMGAERFVQAVAKFGRTISFEEAQKAVYGYRDSVPMIKKFWRQIEIACIRACRKWEPVTFGRFTVRPDMLSNGFKVIYLDMPSGSICYPKPYLDTEEWNGEIRNTFNFWTPLGSSWIRTDTFGGSLTENVIQAMCRDILRDGMLAADKAGFKLIGHVHDEAIAEGDNNPNDLKEFERLLTQSSEWAEGFPILTEGYIAKRYRK